MDEVTLCSEYLCTLQPPKSSALAQGLLSRRVACQQAGLQQDSTGLYPPHVSVTGFFKATQKQAAEVCAIAVTELAAILAPAALPPDSQGGDGLADSGNQCVKVQQVVTTEGGHVLLDIVAPLISNFAKVFAAQCALLGVFVRPKAVRHLSLASGRSPEERASIARFYQDLLVGGCCWDLVVSRLSFRSDVEKLHEGGKMHIFEELLRLKLPCAAKAVDELFPNALTSHFDAAAAAAATCASPPVSPHLQSKTEADHAQAVKSDRRESVGNIEIESRGAESSIPCRAENIPTNDRVAEHYANTVTLVQKQLSSLAVGQDFEVQFSDAEAVRTGHPKVGGLVTQVMNENSMLRAK